MKPLIVRAKADADIDRALAFVARENPARARKLLSALEKTFEAIERFPKTGSERYARELAFPGLRHRLVPRFPWLIFYVELPEEIAVIRVLHQHRDIPEELGE